ncbi:MAG TPA: histidine--tRNA ligase [Longimicrobiales bacterium]|nr:histidine--tRNA ligase [Longimicrobiales bacterium]
MTNHVSLPGFRDFYPSDLAVRSHIMSAWREVARRYGFEEYDGPPLEQLELYVEKSGEEIVRQLYNFEDKGGRAVALRPEMTPTLARMVGAKAGSLRKPIRWFSMPQLFRYERTQRGRLREHYQWNVDIIGEDDIAADAEVLAVALDALRVLGLGAEDVVARYNDRRLLEALLLHAGVRRERLVAAYTVIDKFGRDSIERTRARLAEEADLDDAAVNTVLELFTSAAAVSGAAQSNGLSELRAAHAGNDDVLREIDRLQVYEERLAALGLAEFVRFDPAIVRGLAYYTGTVFEIFDRKGELRAICGGGRYDRLLASVSSADLPAAGFGMGDVVLAELLRDRDLLPDTRPAVDTFIVAMSEAERPLLLQIASTLRARGESVLYSLRSAAVGKQLKEADARGAGRVILLGPDEVARGAATVRSMGTGAQEDVQLDELLAEPASVRP